MLGELIWVSLTLFLLRMVHYVLVSTPHPAPDNISDALGWDRLMIFRILKGVTVPASQIVLGKVSDLPKLQKRMAGFHEAQPSLRH